MSTHLLRSLPKAKRILTFLVLSFCSFSSFSQGTWTAITNVAPATSGGGFTLLSDGTVLCKSSSGGTDGIGSIYNRLTPDASGSYVNGTWTSIAAMNKTRLYYSTQVLKDGRVYVAGGEYGTGGSSGETYNPLTNVWTPNAAIGAFVSDANSEIREDGTVIQALVTGNLKTTKIYDPVANTYTAGPTCVGIHNESAWVKLRDGSILFIDRQSRNSERYIPSLNQWVADGTVPVDIYDPYGLESGGSLLLPDGRAIFFGSTGHNAIYTPSGTNAPGTWVAVSDFPSAQGTPDAPAAMMVNGKILCAVSPKPTSANHFPTPTSFYEYDYLLDSFTRINAPTGGLTMPISVYTTNMIDLPNGQVLLSVQGSAQYYVYTPVGTPLASGKPKLKGGKLAGANTYRIWGTGFNGISEGASYGDDFQMNTNYPLVRLSLGSNVYYARTSNWNSTGVQRGTLPDSVTFTLPSGLPKGTYNLVVVANGIASAATKLTVKNNVPFENTLIASATEGNAQTAKLSVDTKPLATSGLTVYPNPATAASHVSFALSATTHVAITLSDANGKTVAVIANETKAAGTYSLPLKTAGLAHGVYYLKLTTDTDMKTATVAVQ